jgi:hypothetical protein
MGTDPNDQTRDEQDDRDHRHDQEGK